jgi:hypothetical protein
LLNRGILQIKFGQLFSRPCGPLSDAPKVAPAKQSKIIRDQEFTSD